ncbi:MAG: flippase-like domain-containing protein [Bacteroidetes bacterium]|nr:flippase-like domain-containing protein [Bacteroidota bacterium]
MKAIAKKMFKPAIFLALGIFILWKLVDGMSEEVRTQTVEALRQAKYGWVVLSIGCGILSHMSRTQRWRMLIEPLGHYPRYGVTFLCVMISYVANLAVPRLGEVLKCTFLSRYERIPADKVIGTMIAERSVDAITLVLVTLVTLALQYAKLREFFHESVTAPMQATLASNPLLGPGLLIGLAVALFLGWLGWRKVRDSERLERFRDVLRNVKEGLTSLRRVKNLPLFIFHSLFIWAMYYAMVAIAFPALVETAGLGFSAGMAILVFGSVGIIATPGGIGAYQLIVSETLVKLYGVAEGGAFAFANIVWGAQTAMIIVFGLASLAILPLFRVRHQPA